MKISGGASLGIKLKLSNEQYNNETVDATYWCTIEKEISDDLQPAVLADKISQLQDTCREICEEKIDQDIYYVKEVKVFDQIKGIKNG